MVRRVVTVAGAAGRGCGAAVGRLSVTVVVVQSSSAVAPATTTGSRAIAVQQATATEVRMSGGGPFLPRMVTYGDESGWWDGAPRVRGRCGGGVCRPGRSGAGAGGPGVWPASGYRAWTGCYRPDGPLACIYFAF